LRSHPEIVEQIIEKIKSEPAPAIGKPTPKADD
jgi:hypothetical protein